MEQDLATLKSQVQRLAQGENPWLKAAGMFHGDPYFEEWQEAIREYRRQVDNDPDAP
jgi:hypothetical protein